MPNWLVFARFLLPWIVNLIFGQTNVTLKVPLCGQHKHRLKLGTYVAYGLVTVLLVGAFASIGLTAAGNADTGGAVAAACVVILLPTLVALLVIQLTTPRLQELDGRVVRLTAVSPQFSAAVQPASTTTARTPQGQATSYGQGSFSRGASTKSTNKGTVVLLTLSAVALVGFFICVGVAAIMIRANSRPGDSGRMANASGIRSHRDNIATEPDFDYTESKRAFDETVREHRAAFEADPKIASNRPDPVVTPLPPETPPAAPPSTASKYSLKRYRINISLPENRSIVGSNTAVNIGEKLGACYAKRWETVTVVAINQDGTITCNWDSWTAFTYRMMREDLTVAD